jgi:preprotein translocase subunit YajC
MGSLVLFVPFLLVMGGFLYLSSRKQRRVMQATIDLHESLRPGDRVHTTSGMEATVTAIGDDNIDLEIAPGVVTTWMKLAIRDRILPEVDDDEDGDYDELDALDHEADHEADLDPAERETRASKDF